MKSPSCLLLASVAMWMVALAAPGHAQLRSLKAEVTPAVVKDQSVRAGAKVLVTLRVKLPETVHVQSDKPRDRSLIPTALTIEPTAGVTVAKIVYPAATDLVQADLQQPLAVFGHDFTITVHLALAANITPGPLGVPARLRYQPCDETMCYPPARVDTRWTLDVAPPAAP